MNSTSFVSVIRSNGDRLYINIPSVVKHTMKLEKGQSVQVTISVIDTE